MSKVLSTNKLTKRFGRLTAVDALDLEVDEGQVYGILGPNGSGKTTTLGMILDVVAPSQGSYAWFEGEHPVAARKRIGSILETPCFYPYLSAVQNLRIVAHIKQGGSQNIEAVLEQVGLHHRKDDKFKAYSLGMKQRLAVAAALLSDPPVLILDEPTNGLDPEGIAEVRTLIRNIASNGKTIIMASHLLDEVQKVCTDFCILRNGRKLHEGKVSDILGDTNRVELSGSDLKELETALEGFDGLLSKVSENGSVLVELKASYSSSDLNAFCFEKGISLSKVIPQTKSLEQEFLKILKEND